MGVSVPSDSVEPVFERQWSGAGGGAGAAEPVGATVPPSGQPLSGLQPDVATDENTRAVADACTWWPDELETDDAGLDDLAPGGAHAPWESSAGVEDVAPDGMLALVLEEVDITTVDDRMLVETIAGWQRIAAWAQLNSALGAAELSGRVSMNPQWTAPAPADPCVAGDELAMRLGWSRRAATRLVRDGLALDHELLLVARAVREGRLDGAKMRVITDRLAGRAGELAWAVQETVLPGAATRTPTQLAADVDRALLTVEPADAADRLARALTQRHVCHPRRLPDGMAGLWAVLPAADAIRIDATLEATARAARAAGDPRTLDQLRADTLTDLATGHALLAGTAPDAETTQRPGEEPADPAHRRAPAVRIPRVHIDVTVALSTLIGLDDRPAELAGLGPLSAEQARALAAGGTWRRLVTDPLTGQVLDLGRTRYRPPPGLAEHVAARDRTCAAPGCSVPADRCDIDHTTEYHGTPANRSPVPGTTSADNLGPLSHRCHRLKTDGGFTLRQTAPGTFEWRTPAGLRYRVVPGDHGRAERVPASTPPHRGYPDTPPF